jgi:bacterioferritin
MKGDPTVIEFLNKALTNELTAINQYWLHYRVLAHWGVAKLADYERHESIDEMKHADWLADRVLFLGGLPNFQALHRLKVGETVEEILRADLSLEEEAVPLLREAIAHCEQVRDFVSRELFKRILENEEQHIDFLETQFDLIERIGIQNFIQLNSMPAGEGEYDAGTPG